MKKVVKKQLKEDEFVSTINKIVRFIKEQRRELIIVASILVVVIAGIFAIRYFRTQGLKKQSQVVSEMLDLRAGLEKNPGNVAQLEKMGGDQKFARVAYLLLATYWIENGNLDKAEASLTKIKTRPKDLYYYQAQDLLARVYLQRKNYDKAIEIYKKIEKEKPREYSLDVVLFNRAEALEKKGDRAGAAAVFKKVQEEYPQTYYGYDASLRAKKLEGEK
jgi:predicted negative regulator of RcsB-dependent stress response